MQTLLFHFHHNPTRYLVLQILFVGKICLSQLPRATQIISHGFKTSKLEWSENLGGFPNKISLWMRYRAGAQGCGFYTIIQAVLRDTL